MSQNLTQTQRTNIREIARKLDHIPSTFSWDETPQGVDYWSEVLKNLNSIADSPNYVTPTDSDSLSRPQVEVRDNDRSKWFGGEGSDTMVLIAVFPLTLYPFKVANLCTGATSSWKQCRMKEKA